MRRSLVAATAAALLLLTSACGGSSGSSAAGTSGAGAASALTLSAITPPKSFAVGQMASSGPEDTYYQAVYDTLLTLDPQGRPAANLATTWSYDKTNTKLTLTLRSGVTFTDGTKFDAAAVKANLEKAEKATGEAGTALAAIKAVVATDPTHAQIVLSRPDPGLVDVLARSSGYMASPASLNKADSATNPVGSGPYVLDQKTTTPGSVYAYTRNPNYWNKKRYPYDQVQIRFLDDKTATLNGVRSGQIQGMSASTKDLLSGAQSAGLNTVKWSNGSVEGVWLWDRKGKLAPALANLKVRQAINYAMDRSTIVKVVKGGLGTPTVQLFGPSTTAYDKSLEGTYAYNLPKAKALMAEAGYAAGFSMTLPDFSPVFPAEQAAMTEAFTALNIKVQYTPITGDQVVGSIIGGRWPANFFAITASSPFEMASLTLTPHSPFNPFKTTDPKIDALLATASTSVGNPQVAALKKLNAYLVQQAWFAPWDAVQGAYATAKSVSVTPVPGLSIPPLSAFAPSGS